MKYIVGILVGFLVGSLVGFLVGLETGAGTGDSGSLNLIVTKLWSLLKVR